MHSLFVVDVAGQSACWRRLLHCPGTSSVTKNCCSRKWSVFGGVFSVTIQYS